MPDFFPPRLNPGLVRLAQSVSPVVGWWAYRMSLDLDAASLETLINLKNKRRLLLCNHPTLHDWIAIFLLSARTGDQFHYLAAYERFGGPEGWWLQQLGAYSVRRGLGDRPSIAHTIELLTQPDCRLVIFPEGGCSFQNDTVMPFRAGAVQLAMQAIVRVVKQAQTLPELWVVPVSLKYRYIGDMTRAIDATLHRLEHALDVAPPSANFYERLLAVGDRVLLIFEQEYGLLTTDPAPPSRNTRIQRIKTHVLTSCEQALGLVPSAKEPMRERVYRIQRVLAAQTERLTEPNPMNEDAISTAASRLLNFDAIYDGYVAANPTPERFLDTLVRLERAIFGIDQPPPKGHRTVILRVGTPINLGEYFEAYQRDRQIVDTISETLRQSVQQTLDQLSRSS